MSTQSPIVSGRASSPLTLGIACLVLGAGLFRSSSTVADPDLWGHIRFGRDILAGWSIPRTDDYSYLSQSDEWINHEWLCEVLLAGLFDNFGTRGLLVFKTVILLGSLGLVFRHLLIQGGQGVRPGIVLLLVLIMLLVGCRTVRPQLFTYFLFLHLLLMLYYAGQGHCLLLWFVPLLLAVWSNLHGGFLAGLGILFVWAVVHSGSAAYNLARGTQVKFVALLGILAASAGGLLATFLTPYGTGLLAFLMRTATASRPEISEWAPIHLLSVDGIAYLAFLALGFFGLVFSRRPRSAA